MVDLFGEAEAPETDPQDAVTHDTFPTAEHNHQLTGHEECLSRCRAMLEAGQFPHGLVLTGIEGVGKHLLSLHIAELLMGEGKLHRMIQGGYPDLLMLGREMDEKKGRLKPDLPIATIRKIPVFLRQTPAEGGWRTVIVDDADHMNRNAQNALLKSLEEPPKQSCLILIVHQLGRLIPTIRSRVRVMHLAPLELGQVRDIITEKHALTPGPLALALSGGSVGKALELSDERISADVLFLIQLLPIIPGLSPKEREEMTQTLAAGQDPITPLKILLRLMDMDMLNQLDMNALPMEASQALTQWKQSAPLATRLKIRDKLKDAINTAEAAYLDRLALSDMVIDHLQGKGL